MSHGPTKWQVALAIGRGLLIAAAFYLVGRGGLAYVAPAKNVTAANGSLPPIVETHWIKVPFDILRSKECLAQSTITLRREHDYGGGIGKREDIVKLDLYNTTITGTGLHKVMLWFVRPANLFGTWDYDSKTQDDCGGILDLTNGEPRHTVVTSLDLGPEP